jgi:hypothetical protein
MAAVPNQTLASRDMNLKHATKLMALYACLMTLGAFVRNKSHRSAFQNADLWWWLDRLTLGL